MGVNSETKCLMYVVLNLRSFKPILYKRAHSVVLDTITAGVIGLIENWCFSEFTVSEESKGLLGFLLRRRVSFHDLKCVTATTAPVRTQLQRYALISVFSMSRSAD